MSGTTVSLRLPIEVLDRIDAKTELSGESRSEYTLRWCPAYHGEAFDALPEAPDPTDAKTTQISISVPKDTFERIDRAAASAGVSRADYLLSWQPGYYLLSNSETPEEIPAPV